MNLCKGCGKKILWGITRQGKQIPLDPKPPVYLVKGNPRDGHQPLEIERLRHVYVSHFATCPKANDFSNQSKKEADCVN